MKRFLDDLVRWAGWAFFWGTLFFLAAPLIVTIVLSFDARDYLGAFPPSAFSTKWYSSIFGNAYLQAAVKTSLIVAVTTTILSTIIGTSAAFVLDRFHFIGRDAITTFLMMPLIVPGVVLGFALLIFLSSVSIESGLLRLMIGHCLITIPYVVRTVLGSLVGLRKNYIEAALGLGATPARALMDIVLPLAKTGIVTGAFFAFAFSLDDVALSVFLTDADHVTIPVALISLMRSSFDMSTAAMAVLLIGLTALLVFLLDRTVGFENVVGRGIYRNQNRQQ